MSTLKRRVPPDAATGVAGPAAAGEWGSSLPSLAEFLVATTWEDGSPRIPGTLTLFTDADVWKICLADKAQSLVAFVSGLSPLQAFQAAEDGLLRDTLDWRPSSPRRGNKKG